MGYAVLHSEKGKGGSGGIGNHIDRQKGMEHTYPHADPKRFSENQAYKVHQDRQKMSLPQAINDRINEGYTGTKAIRKDAVKFTTHVLTGSHEDMKAIFNDKEKSKAWIQENYNFVAKEFGKENIVRFNLHMDEKTPHIHVVTVPLTTDGRLSAREQFGNKTELRNRQDRYAEAMKPFELQRGKRRTGISHDSAQEYYSRMEIANKVGESGEDLTVKRSVLGVDIGIDKEKTIEALKTSLTAQKTALKSKDLELQQTKTRLEESKDRAYSVSIRYDNLLSSDERYKAAQDKKVKSIQKELQYAVKRRFDRVFSLQKFTPAERKEAVEKAMLDKVRELKTGQELFDKALTKGGFHREMVQAIEKKAEIEQERSQNRGRSGGLER